MSAVVLLLVAALLVAGGAGWRVRIARQAQQKRLESPWLGGVPLPAVDDSRWRLHSDHIYRGAVLGTDPRQGGFFVARYDSGILFDGAYVGAWKQYAAAVFAVLDARALEERADKALKAIEAAK